MEIKEDNGYGYEYRVTGKRLGKKKVKEITRTTTTTIIIIIITIINILILITLITLVLNHKIIIIVDTNNK